MNKEDIFEFLVALEADSSHQMLNFNLHLCDLSAFVVASKDGQSIFEADLQGNEKSDCLDGVVSAIDIVTHEQIVGVGRLSTNLK